MLLVKVGDGGIEMFVDRGAKNRDRGVGIAQAGGICGRNQLLPTTRPNCSRAFVSIKGIWPALTVSILA